MNMKFPRATYHTIVPSTEELCCLNSDWGLAGSLRKGAVAGTLATLNIIQPLAASFYANKA